MTGQNIVPITVTGSVNTSQEIQIPSGFTLVGVDFPELTSTSFTITHAPKSGGTFVTLKDPLGIYGTAGNAITFTIGTTSAGIFQIPPSVTALLYSYMKIVLSSSETAGINLIFKDLA